ncbi:MAG TPA: radical SAM protein [Bacteroidales bacterium]|nr:radical SAM protein [Bacteroidales bacterium]
MFDRFNRHINYLRISVTDRCNLRCRYCMPEEGVQHLRHDDILTFEEITSLVRAAVSMGIDKIRLTGGEPLIRKGIADLVAMIASVPGVRDLALTTNGFFLKEYAGSLKKAGLHRVNVSLDTLDPEKFKRITRGGDVRQVLEGIRAACDAGLHPVKINCVVFKSSNEEDALLVRDYASREGLQVRFIRQMDLETGEFSLVEGGDGGNCEICNRLRVTANGMVKPCLFNDQEFPVRILGAQQALINALNAKPQKGCNNKTGKFYNIGG